MAINNHSKAIENVFLMDMEESITLGDWDEEEEKASMEDKEDATPSEAEKNGQF